MNLYYIKQNSLSNFEYKICQSYYENTDRHTTSITHLQHLCNQYHITIDQLAAITQKVKAYHPQTHCIACNVAQRIYQPDYNHLQHLQQNDYICDDCKNFIHAPNQTQYIANMPLLVNQPMNDDLPY